ncbi:MAG: hypothetical protein UT05_C0001G0037 [Parcubacteria group bacterium GW2011_GWF2_38_76]|nr:MAG: hypothetical protein UT05_C0001G0037 [Parcubacteria group bacterium GW2011_GWF2_38_76]HBM45986.1 hypothetical protein [Patescibacteria group bacterium]
MGFGTKTWREIEFNDNLFKRQKKRILGLTFPATDINLGLEPSILNVLPPGDNVEYITDNRLFNDSDVEYYACSVYISGYDEFTKWATQHNPKKIIVGGYHPTTFPEEFERYALKIVQGPCDDFYATISQEGQVVRGIISNKNLPRRDLYDIYRNQQIIPDKMPQDTVVSINTSIGCNMKPPCDFCCTPMMCDKLLSKPIEMVENEARDLQKYSPKFIFIRDENFTMQKDWKSRLRILHEILPDTRIYLFASANTLNEERIRFMSTHGVYMVCLGMEDPTVTYQKNSILPKVIELLKKNDVKTYLSFIVNPLKIIGKKAGENFYNLLTERFKELAPEMVCGNFLMPFRGTKLWDEYYAYVSPEDYKHYDSKTPFLVRNPVLREKMKFFMFWYQWKYYTSDFYQKNVRKFDSGDTLHLRFMELYNHFKIIYERNWNIRA